MSMCIPLEEPLVERSRTTTLGIPIQKYFFRTLGGAPTTQTLLAGTLLEVIGPFDLTRPSELKIAGLKLEMLEKYTGS